MLDPRLERDVKAAEGCKLTAYRDSRGLWTIGYGHLLDQREDQSGVTCTQEQADAWFDADLEAAQAQAERLPEWRGLNIVRQNTVTELVYNLGITHWMGFKKCRNALELGDWDEAWHQLLMSNAYEQEPDRIRRLAERLRDGVYPA